MELQYYIEEPKGGTVWKIPKSFSAKMLSERLQHLPAIFRNQGLTLNIDTFEQIIQSDAFEFKIRAKHVEEQCHWLKPGK